MDISLILPKGINVKLTSFGQNLTFLWEQEHSVGKSKAVVFSKEPLGIKWFCILWGPSLNTSIENLLLPLLKKKGHFWRNFLLNFLLET